MLFPYPERGEHTIFSIEKFVIHLLKTLIINDEFQKKFVIARLHVKKMVFSPTFALENRTQHERSITQTEKMLFAPPRNGFVFLFMQHKKQDRTDAGCCR